MITIISPINISFDIIELEEQIPSVKMDIHYDCIEFSGECSGGGIFWFTDKEWNTFLSKLNEVRNFAASEALLVDMENEFSLSVFNHNGAVFFSLKHGIFRNQNKMFFWYEKIIDADCMAHLIKQFDELRFFCNY